jgi:hypothetical protein
MSSSIFNPTDSFSMFPFAMFLLTFGVDIDTIAVLLALVPVADVLATVRPLESALTLLHIVYVVAHIFPAVWPGEGTVTFHLVVTPLA